jgi:hypothetical protein
MAKNIATFELRLSAIDKPTERKRWNGGPLASPEANDALRRAVKAFRASAEADGFETVHIGYGVTARTL